MHDQATYVETTLLPLSRLTPFPGNAKVGDVPTILASLRRNGQYRGLVVRSDGDVLTVLAGNHTMQALAEHGPGPCGITVKTPKGDRPCAVCQGQEWTPSARAEIYTCDEDTARRINLVDNRSSEIGSYDYTALSELLSGLDDLDGTGYSDRDVEDIAALLALPDEEPKDDSRATRNGDTDEEEDTGDPDVFNPVINLRVPHAVFDRWRAALDAHPGIDDTAKFLGLLDEVEQARARVTP